MIQLLFGALVVKNFLSVHQYGDVLELSKELHAVRKGFSPWVDICFNGEAMEYILQALKRLFSNINGLRMDSSRSSISLNSCLYVYLSLSLDFEVIFYSFGSAFQIICCFSFIV